MNMKDKDVNSSGVETVSTNLRIRTKLLSTLGAGVNADSTVNMAYATTDDPLSELVWSPNNGLSLKRANPRADDRKPFLLWNVGPSSAEGPSPLQSIILKSVVDQENLTISQSALDADDLIIDKALLEASENSHILELGPSHADVSESDRKMEEAVDGEAELCHPQTVPTDGIAESGKEIGERSKEVSSAVIPATPLKKLESSSENGAHHLTEKDECTLGGAQLPTENALPAEVSCTSSRIRLYQGKGKGKALSDGDIYGRPSDFEDDNSHESADSSNSAGLSSKGMKGIKRQIYDEDARIRSKRMKKHIHGSDGSNTKSDNSFMKWIWNMTRGLSESTKEDSLSPLPLACSNDVYSKNYSENFLCFKPQDSASIRMGFRTMFQSLYYRESDASNTGGKKIVESEEEESREHVVDDEKSPGNLPESYDRNGGNSSESDVAKDGVTRTDPLGEETKISAKEAYPGIPVATGDVLERSNPRRTSLWITRLSTKTLRLEKGREIAEEAVACSTSCPKADLDRRVNAETGDESADSKANASIKESQKIIINSEASFEVKSVSQVSPVLPSQIFSSEAMASVFAKRLDALRHITSSKKGIYSTCSNTCLFCGRCHNVRECPSVTKSELEDLLLKLSTFDSKVQESSSLCIRCSQSDHWAVSCPVAPSSRQRISDEKASFGARHLQLYAGSGRREDHMLVPAERTDCSSKKSLVELFPTYRTRNVEISSSKRAPTSNEMQRSLPSKSTKDLEDKQSFPLRDIANLQITVAQSEIFNAIRNLRLTRADILRWMNSDVPLSHLNGFFLRLRLGKPEAGLGESSYYVACITAGDVRENKGCTWKKSILVDVGGIKSSVASQYVSNHDFLENEIKAWWSRIVGSGCRIPSLAELNSKLKDRQSLGF